MSGLYIHIPFCKQACHYCNFHFSTSLHLADEMVEAICSEIELRKNYLPDNTLKSVYVGGGTPSLLTYSQLKKLFEHIKRFYNVEVGAEITLEANPDDLNPAKLNELYMLGINRLSIGLQSFDDTLLKWMNRAHTAQQALQCLINANQAGIHQASVDLIYGIPSLSTQKWHDTLNKVLDSGVQHISAYCLTIEEKTALYHAVKMQKEKPVDEEAALKQFEMLTETLAMHGYEHYEISNFARNKQYAVHNTSYWQNKPYIGVGPSAHSYNGTSRQWNVANNVAYIKQIKAGSLFYEQEILSNKERYNETVMTGLRTMWGVSESQLLNEFGEYYQANRKVFDTYREQGILILDKGAFVLAHSHRFMADGIASSLFA